MAKNSSRKNQIKALISKNIKVIQQNKGENRKPEAKGNMTKANANHINKSPKNMQQQGEKREREIG